MYKWSCTSSKYIVISDTFVCKIADAEICAYVLVTLYIHSYTGSANYSLMSIPAILCETFKLAIEDAYLTYVSKCWWVSIVDTYSNI